MWCYVSLKSAPAFWKNGGRISSNKETFLAKVFSLLGKQKRESKRFKLTTYAEEAYHLRRSLHLSSLISRERKREREREPEERALL